MSFPPFPGPLSSLAAVLFAILCLGSPVTAQEEKSLHFLWEKGRKALDGGDADGALEAYTEALEADRENPRSWSYLGGIHFRRGDYEQALLHFKQAFLLDPGDVRACNNIGTTYERLGRYGKAERFYLAAVGIDEGYPVSYRNLGVLYAEHLGRPDRARRYWEEYLALVPVGEESDTVRSQLELLGEGGSAGSGPGRAPAP